MKLTLKDAWVNRHVVIAGQTRLQVYGYRTKRDKTEEEVIIDFEGLSVKQLACLAGSIFLAMKEHQADITEAFRSAGWSNR